MFIPDCIDSILISSDRIQSRVIEMGQQITDEFQGQEILLLSILKGSIFFSTDLSRAIRTRTELGFMAVSSYGNSTVSSGEVKIVMDLDKSIAGKNVIIVEDIVDTGLTLSYLLRVLHERKPKTLKVASLLSKPDCRKVEIPIDYLGFAIENKFVVGYGLDFIQFYRNLPYIGVLHPRFIQQAQD